MLQTKDSVDLRTRLTDDHLESRKSIVRLRARLEAMSVALDLAAAHVDYAIRGVENPGQGDAFRAIPSPETLLAMCAEYRAEMRHSLELAADLAALGERSGRNRL